MPLKLLGMNCVKKKTLSDESIDQGVDCAHMHSIAGTQKILMFMSLMGECCQQKHPDCTSHEDRM